MRSLWSELRPLLRYVAVFSCCINLLFLTPAIFMMQVFDRVIPSGSQETLVVLLGGTGVALFIMLLLEFVRGRLQGVLGTIVDERLSPPVMSAVVEHASRSSKFSTTEAVRDVSALRGVFSSNGLIAVFDAPWVVVYVFVIAAFHPYLGIGAAIAGVIMLVLAWLNDRLSRTSLEDLQGESRRVSRYVESSLRNAEVLQALGMTDRLLARWRLLHGRLATQQMTAGRTGTAFSATTKCVRQSIQILMLSLGAYLVLTQQASAGIMIATTIVLGRALQPVEQVVGNWRALAEARAAYRRLDALSTEFKEDNPYVGMPRPEGSVTVEGMAFRAPDVDTPVLVNVAFAIAPGEALAIIGPSAAGKSTLARLLTGVWRPTTGKVRLDGVDVSYWPREDLGQWMGYVPQDVELFDGTVADNIARLGEVDSQAVVAAAQRANVHELVLSLPQGYDTPVGEQGSLLSPGQRQRIALARALYGDPRLVILDEPNSNLDGAGEIALAQVLRALRQQGVTSVVVTHRPSLVAHVDKILELVDGRVKQFGSAAEVLKAKQREAQAMADGRAA